MGAGPRDGRGAGMAGGEWRVPAGGPRCDRDLRAQNRSHGVGPKGCAKQGEEMRKSYTPCLRLEQHLQWCEFPTLIHEILEKLLFLLEGTQATEQDLAEVTPDATRECLAGHGWRLEHFSSNVTSGVCWSVML